jgi:hypothetical protein
MNQEPSPDASHDDHDILPEIMLIEIASLHSCSYGQTFCMHEICGENVKVSNLLRLLPTVVDRS